MVDYINAESFYQDAGDKIKLNWFCYEYANNLYTAIKESSKLTQYRRGHTPDQITKFCLYFTKRMRKSIYERNTGKAGGIEIDERYVYEFYPKNTAKRTQSLLEAALSAWDGQFSMCVNCPNRCLTECFDLSDMFDNLKRTGWPT
jgi:hypothetical protein